jgi:hypothetical protein
MPKKDFRLWVVTGLAIISPILSVGFTRGQETQKLQDTILTVQSIKADLERTKAEQLQINKELINTLTEVRITMKEISTKLQMMEKRK